MSNKQTSEAPTSSTLRPHDVLSIGSQDWSDDTPVGRKMTLSRADRYKWYWQVVLTTIVLFSCITAAFIIPVFYGFTDAWYFVVGIGTNMVSLHFNLKSYKKSKPRLPVTINERIH